MIPKYTIEQRKDGSWKVVEETDLGEFRTIADCPTDSDAMYISMALNEFHETNPDKPTELVITPTCDEMQAELERVDNEVYGVDR
jgi:hypothetical protein